MHEYRSLDHKRLVLRRRTEITRAIRMFRDSYGVNEGTIMHEANNSCCKAEPWPVTLAFVLKQADRRTLIVET